VIRLIVSFGLLLALTRESAAAPIPDCVFTVSPLDPGQIREIIPLGNLNPMGGHVFPTDHVYLNYANQPGLTVLAPAAGMVTAVRNQLGGGSKVEIRVDKNISYYLAHLNLEAGIRAGTKVSAGQKLGLASGRSMLDLGASDARVRLFGFVNPARYPLPMVQAISPLKLFSEPLRTQLYAKVMRKGPDKDGKIDLDSPARLLGNWFHENLSVKDGSRGDPQVWAKQLSFAYDVRDPGAVRISIGGTIAPAGLYAVAAAAPDPAQVGAETGLVKYRLAAIGGKTSKPPNPDSGLLLVQLLDEHRLKVEYFTAPTGDDAKDFDQRSTVYER
jgi:hypothetical protein